MSYLSFESHQNSVLSKMVKAISFCALKNRKVFSLSGKFLQTFRAKNIKSGNKQVTWGINGCHNRQKFDLSMIFSLGSGRCQRNDLSRKLSSTNYLLVA